MPLRRPHTKSHHGCSHCKQRRIKCDETRPICGPCRRKDLNCTFNNSLPAHPLPLSLGENHQWPKAVRTIGLPLCELELLHHWHTATADSLIENETLSAVLQTQVPKAGLEHPFVMHSILSISALHLSQQYSGPRRQRYIDIGVQHHSQALALFVPLLSDVNPQNCDSLFVCSFLTSAFSSALHVPMIHASSMQVSEVVEIFKLVRGTASIVERARQWIEQGDMRLLLNITRCAQRLPQSRHFHEIYGHLEALIDYQADVSHHPQLTSSTRAVINRSTQHLLEVCVSSIASDNQAIIFAWPAIVDAEYLDHLQQVKPWSLVTLAHYGAVLHTMTNAWWMASWGKFLVNVVRTHLDETAQSAIAWPLAVVSQNADG